MEKNKLTPKKRANVYKTIAIKFAQKKQRWNFICGEIEELLPDIRKFGISYKKMIEDNFPELLLIRPEEHFSTWFSNNDENKERIIALLFAHQMALDATE